MEGREESIRWWETPQLCRWERTIAEERAGESPEGASCGIEEMEDETGRSESKALSR